MESSLIIGIGSALMFGVLTSISPCPLATNIAAVAYIGRELKSPLDVVFSGLLYTLGRMLSYTILGITLVKGFMAVFDVANFMQQYTNQILGFILVFVGLVLFEIVKFPTSSNKIFEKLSDKVASYGMFGSFLLGSLFALSFCPISAALFFGSLISLAINLNSSLLLPAFYGIGTALPVLFFAIAFGVGGNVVAKTYNKLTAVEKWARKITGTIFIVVGGYYIYQYIVG